jgi:hypothetical protein
VLRKDFQPASLGGGSCGHNYLWWVATVDAHQPTLSFGSKRLTRRGEEGSDVRSVRRARARCSRTEPRSRCEARRTGPNTGHNAFMTQITANAEDSPERVLSPPVSS